ncbi:MAG TPA: hypothetical protein VF054_02620 [Micromonosporaceae bacterium]
MTTPAWQPLPPPVRRTGLSRRTVSILVVVAVALVCGGGGVLLYRTAQRAVGPARQTTVEFITDLQAGNATAAYDRLCNGTRTRISRAAFIQGVAAQPRIRSYKIEQVKVSDINGKVSATVAANLTLDSGFVDQHTFPLVKEGGQWRVCGQPY